MTTKFPLSGILGVNFDQADDAAEFRLGSVEVDGSTGTHYVYVQADEDLAAYGACARDESFNAVELTTTVSGAVPTPVVIPQVALADGQYGWAVCGPGSAFLVLAKTLAALNVKLYTTGTAGEVDDEASGTDLIEGLRLDATNAAGTTVATTATAATVLSTNTQS